MKPYFQCNGMEQLRIDEQQRHNQNHNPLDRHYSNDDTRVSTYDYLKTSDPSTNRLSAPDYSSLKQFPLSNSLTDLCGGMHAHAYTKFSLCLCKFKTAMFVMLKKKD